MKILEIDKEVKFKPFAIEFDDKPEIYDLVYHLESLVEIMKSETYGCELVVEGYPTTKLLRLLESRLKK